MQTRLIGSTSYFSKAQLEATNFSRAEGIDAATEFKWRKTTGNLVKQAIKKLKLPDWVYETAMTYINRYFLTRSISKAERFSVVGGAVLLASKVQESPRAIYDIAFVLHELKNANKQQLGPDQRQVEKLMEDMVVAEQAMLFALNFNLVVETHVSLARRLLEPLDLWPKQQPALEEVEANQLKLFLFQAILRFLNDSALTNLSLQYPNQKVAAVALVMAAKRLAVRYTGKVMPSALQRAVVLANDAAWFEARGLTLEAAADIEAQISDLYATAPDPALAQKAKPSAPQQVALQQVPQQAPEQAAISAGKARE
ncbi:CYCM1 protein [Gonium pectorale]|uniref:CYCM1 protein n=1 Tax=Gonium pectorale TaxID=33097 RepID=A0A150FVY4_GONPE|nr:CYCM1 protein [Gonium pectorale]|eukprot:KXZ41190.1 CYCM1 protein [Gonium pectorale]